MEVDHIYIGTNNPDECAEKLIDFGFTEGSSNVHPGQGTSNRRFFFKNSMLELLYVSNVEEVINSRTSPLLLNEQCNNGQNTCPFGAIFRPSLQSEQAPLFDFWLYKPIYLPEPLSIKVAPVIHQNEPRFYYLDFAKNRTDDDNSEPTTHKIGLENIFQYQITVKDHFPKSDFIETMSAETEARLIYGDDYLIELFFTKETPSNRKDFRPTIPMIIYW
ncbi:MAG: VOC family protein [Bacteroidetes bacterium]|nr:VOC family protein [Bacteroidota bacterium]